MISIILVAVILLISIAIGDRILLNSYGQTLDKTYTNQKCGIFLQYPSDWKINEDLLEYKTGDVIHFIVELQPDKEVLFNNVVGIELDYTRDNSFEGLKDFEEWSKSEDEKAHSVKVEKIEPTQIAGYPAEKIIYHNVGLEDKIMDVLTFAFDREYKITYESDPENFDKYLTTVEKMLQTFTITQPTFEGINC